MAFADKTLLEVRPCWGHPSHRHPCAADVSSSKALPCPQASPAKRRGSGPPNMVQFALSRQPARARWRGCWGQSSLPHLPSLCCALASSFLAGDEDLRQ